MNVQVRRVRVCVSVRMDEAVTVFERANGCWIKYNVTSGRRVVRRVHGESFLEHKYIFQ